MHGCCNFRPGHRACLHRAFGCVRAVRSASRHFSSLLTSCPIALCAPTDRSSCARSTDPQALQSNDGHTRPFTLRGISLDISVMPIAHTCFNRVDVPVYETKEALETALTEVINMEVTGFTME